MTSGKIHTATRSDNVGMCRRSWPRTRSNALQSAHAMVFYLLSGLAAFVAQIVAMPGSLVPNLGASGAIAEECLNWVVVRASERNQRASLRCLS